MAVSGSVGISSSSSSSSSLPVYNTADSQAVKWPEREGEN
jgi:hypothetical protein